MTKEEMRILEIHSSKRIIQTLINDSNTETQSLKPFSDRYFYNKGYIQALEQSLMLLDGLLE